LIDEFHYDDKDDFAEDLKNAPSEQSISSTITNKGSTTSN